MTVKETLSQELERRIDLRKLMINLTNGMISKESVGAKTLPALLELAEIMSDDLDSLKVDLIELGL